ncbi:protein kinase [Nonomuraea thailandensis]
MAMGTPSYLAPEQLSGAQVSEAADVFAWGVTMVFAATGKPAFGADSIPVVMNRILNEEPELGKMEGLLGDLVAACLSKDPAQRPSADELIVHLTGQPAPKAAIEPVTGGQKTTFGAAGAAAAAAGSGAAGGVGAAANAAQAGADGSGGPGGAAGQDDYPGPWHQPTGPQQLPCRRRATTAARRPRRPRAAPLATRLTAACRATRPKPARLRAARPRAGPARAAPRATDRRRACPRAAPPETAPTAAPSRVARRRAGPVGCRSERPSPECRAAARSREGPAARRQALPVCPRTAPASPSRREPTAARRVRAGLKGRVAEADRAGPMVRPVPVRPVARRGRPGRGRTAGCPPSSAVP